MPGLAGAAWSELPVFLGLWSSEVSSMHKAQLTALVCHVPEAAKPPLATYLAPDAGHIVRLAAWASQQATTHISLQHSMSRLPCPCNAAHVGVGAARDVAH